MTDIDRATVILRSGGLVAFPTETVYGLGADATNPAAVQRIFTAKGRPSTNPLIVHVPDATAAQRYVTNWPLAASRLAEHFWPGPLTLVLPKHPSIVDSVTAGLPTVGLRVPNHPLALDLLRAVNLPIAAPSANRSTRVSPTTAQHVRDELGHRVDLILDGGPCTVGIESTVLDLSSNSSIILRPGAITREMLEPLIGPVHLFTGSTSAATAATSPGQHDVHYAPATPAFRFEISDRSRIEAEFTRNKHAAYSLLLLGRTSEQPFELDELRKGPGSRWEMPADPAQYAHVLYRTLRAEDERHLDAIYIELPPDLPAWTAVRDRIRRATQPLPI